VGGAHVVQPKLVTHRRTEHVIEHQAECSYIGHTGILNDHAVQGRRKLDVSPATRNRVTFAAVRSPRSRPTPIESGSTTKALSVHNVSGHESASSRQVTGPAKKPNAAQRSRRRSISTTAASRSTSRSTQVKIPLDPASSATTASHRVKTEARRVRPPATCPGQQGPKAVHSEFPLLQVRATFQPFCPGSQAEYAGSIPVIRSHTKAPGHRVSTVDLGLSFLLAQSSRWAISGQGRVRHWPRRPGSLKRTPQPRNTQSHDAAVRVDTLRCPRPSTARTTRWTISAWTNGHLFANAGAHELAGMQHRCEASEAHCPQAARETPR
jgi:hypothetical protein